MSHQWLPTSPCGIGCLPQRPDRVSAMVVVGRWLALAVVASCLVLVPLTRLLPAGTRGAVHRALARMALRGIGIRLDVVGGPVRVDGGTLVVAGHVSWLDVLVLAAVLPGQFVARADLTSWPLLGAVARRVRVIPIDRENLRALPATVVTVRERLTAGGTVIAFPEGTTWCGPAFGRFRPALFQAAIDARRPVLPLAVDYADASGERTTGPCFVGEDSIGASMRRVLRSRGVHARVVAGELQQPGTDRRELADRCERQVRRHADVGSDGVLEVLARLETRAHAHVA
ncbi:lysophospholipid acyltransferase family protein [Prescottella agglutinans]|uniref:1-acyl-sn-glycerol-3-phosphate acyltransferase n=1 Tax=Prescottella agglutinans TaxID=1644129 RepID=A0ABT6MCR0_9NOCA|nr:lysophospholipid acyltransferase family protein [Prescottella agglutinans]MDH6282107.1 1-acyl-sn-glycerol-3-phosphate acyltransferase [Prescottella agglutinans]